MKYTKRAFGKQLAEQISSGYDAQTLSKWAYRQYLDHANDLEDGLRSSMMTIVAMGEGEEFKLPENAIQELIRNLLDDHK